MRSVEVRLRRERQEVTVSRTACAAEVPLFVCTRSLDRKWEGCAEENAAFNGCCDKSLVADRPWERSY